MGLIKALTRGVGTVFADQWKEYFQCDSMSNDILIKKGIKVTSGNNKGVEDIISNGSAIAVNEGQVALIVEDGKIVDFTAEAGRFTWDKSTEPSMFCGGFFKGLGESLKKMGERFTYSGDAAKTQRVYYVNVKEIMGNKFGTSTPMVYNDPYYNTALYLRYFGQYSFKIADPIVFYTVIAGNVTDTYTRAQLESLCTDEFMSALDTSLALCSGEGIRFSELPQKQREISRYMSTTLDEDWVERRGMQIVSVALTKVTPDEKSRERIEQYDTNVMHSNPQAMAGGMAYAQMQAMQEAAKNENGAMTGFLGMGMAVNGMANNAASQNTLLESAKQMDETKKAAQAPKAGVWVCECGAENTGKFCNECGKKKPEEKKDDEWTCSCGQKNTGKFCSECGAKKPNGEYICKECGYKTKEALKFCPECGSKF